MADFLNIEEVLSRLTLKKDMMAAEFGCGSAVFAIALARKLDKGRVYALDIQEEKLSALKGKVSQQKINNVFPILCDLEAKNGSTLKDNSLDVVLIPNILFQVDNKSAIIEEAKRILKQGGQLLIIDWLKKSSFGPEDLIKPEDIKKLAENTGLTLKDEFSSGDYHYGLLFIK